MEITASIPDELVNEIRHYAEGENLSESLINVIEEWLYMRKIKELNDEIETKPFEFSRDFSSDAVLEPDRYRDFMPVSF